MAAQAAAGIYVAIYYAISQGTKSIIDYKTPDIKEWYLSSSDILSTLIIFLVYLIGLIKSFKAVNVLAESKITVWALKM